jgi:hypothetical protein
MRLLVFLLLSVYLFGSQPRSLPRDEARAQRRSAVTKAPAVPRSAAARREFVRNHPCPATHKTTGACPGYVVDHIVPLACGGVDAPSNMQWQTVEEAKRKDRTERAGCSGAK